MCLKLKPPLRAFTCRCTLTCFRHSSEQDTQTYVAMNLGEHTVLSFFKLCNNSCHRFMLCQKGTIYGYPVGIEHIFNIYQTHKGRGASYYWVN